MVIVAINLPIRIMLYIKRKKDAGYSHGVDLILSKEFKDIVIGYSQVSNRIIENSGYRHSPRAASDDEIDSVLL